MEKIRRVRCNYCSRLAELVCDSTIYGKRFGDVWICKPCDAYVGCHKGTDRPKGTLANKELREARKEAHEKFDVLWKNKLMSRKEAYAELTKRMGRDEQVHIGECNVEECAQVVECVKSIFYEITDDGSNSLHLDCWRG